MSNIETKGVHIKIQQCGLVSHNATKVRFMSSSSSLCASSFPFQSSEFGSSSISNRLAQMIIELEQSFYNMELADEGRGHETAHR